MNNNSKEELIEEQKDLINLLEKENASMREVISAQEREIVSLEKLNQALEDRSRLDAKYIEDLQNLIESELGNH